MNAYQTSPTVRYAIRAVFAALLVFCGSLVTATATGGISGNEWAVIAYATVGALAGYLGVGAGTPLEPFVGLKWAKVPVEVPMPPAIPEPQPEPREALKEAVRPTPKPPTQSIPPAQNIPKPKPRTSRKRKS